MQRTIHSVWSLVIWKETRFLSEIMVSMFSKLNLIV